jgi:GNAT superfamily N-acetyltransferase
MMFQRLETTITYLAMDAPRELPPLPRAARLDLVRVERIPLHYYRYLYGTVGRPWLWYERLLLDDDALAEAVHKPGIEIFVLHTEGAPAGYYELDYSGAPETNLAYFGLMPDRTGQGLGPWFLGSAIEKAFAQGTTQLTVNTCTLDHPAALPLYQRLGFVITRQELRRLRIPTSLYSELRRQTAAI